MIQSQQSLFKICSPTFMYLPESQI